MNLVSALYEINATTVGRRQKIDRTYISQFKTGHLQSWCCPACCDSLHVSRSVRLENWLFYSKRPNCLIPDSQTPLTLPSLKWLSMLSFQCLAFFVQALWNYISPTLGQRFKWYIKSNCHQSRIWQSLTGVHSFKEVLSKSDLKANILLFYMQLNHISINFVQSMHNYHLHSK